MKQNTGILIMAVIVAGAGAISWKNVRSVVIARADNRRLLDQNVALGREIHQLAARRALAVTRTESNRRVATQATPPSPVNAPASPHKAAPDASTLMAQNPALRDLFQRYTQAQLGFQFRPFYHAANLSPEMITRFQATIIEQKQEDMDLASACRTSDVTAADASRLRADQQHMHEAQLRQLLGNDDYTKYEEFRRIEPMEPVVASVATLGAETGEPLTESQGEHLLTVLANTSRSFQQGGEANPWNIDLPQLLTRAAPILSPNQFAVLRGNADLAQAFKLAEQYQNNRSKPEAVNP